MLRTDSILEAFRAKKGSVQEFLFRKLQFIMIHNAFLKESQFKNYLSIFFWGGKEVWGHAYLLILRPKTKVSVSVSIFETIFIKSQSQSQNLIPILKVSVSVSKIETGYTESQSQSQHAKTGLAHP